MLQTPNQLHTLQKQSETERNIYHNRRSTKDLQKGIALEQLQKANGAGAKGAHKPTTKLV